MNNTKISIRQSPTKKTRWVPIALLVLLNWWGQKEPANAAIALANCSPNQKPTAARTNVEIEYVGLRRQKPPHVQLFFDITLHNDRSEPRWFVLPYHLIAGMKSERGGVDGASVLALQGQGRAIVTRLRGTGGFQALLLPPGAQIQLHHLSIEFWGELPPDELTVEIVTAKELTIGGQSLSSWLGIDPSSSRWASVTAEQYRELAARHTLDDREVPISLVEDRRLTLEIDINSRSF